MAEYPPGPAPTDPKDLSETPPESPLVSPVAAESLSDGPTLYAVDIPIPPALLYQLGRRTQHEDVEAGGVYDDKIAAIAVYDRPWLNPEDPGPARILGVIYLSTRTNRVYRIEVHPETGGTVEALLTHLEHLTEPDE